MEKPSKICEVCGREMTYRKSWAKNWDQVKYCSERCRRNKKSEDFRSAILDLLKVRGTGKTICPSEVLAADDKQNSELMEKVRMSARKLASEGLIDITQKGQVVDATDFRGPIRLRLKSKP